MKKFFIIPLFLVLFLPIVFSLIDSSYSTSQSQNYDTNTNPFSTPASLRANSDFERQFGGAVYSQDFLSSSALSTAGRGFSFGPDIYMGESIIVNVANYEPKQVRESLLDQSNAPVYMYLKGTTIGTLLSPLTNDPSQRDVLSGITSIPRITGIKIFMNRSSEDFDYLADTGINYIPPKSNRVSLDNLGAVIVYLKKFTKDTPKPENDNIKLDMNAIIYLDTSGSSSLLGVNEQSLSLKSYPKEDEFFKNKLANSFFSGKGFMRAVSISDNDVALEVYGKDLFPLAFYNPSKTPAQENGVQAKSSFRLTKGASRFLTFGYTGNPFQDVFQVTLTDIITPTDRADFELQVEGRTVNKKVNLNQELYPGSSWTLKAVDSRIIGSGDCPTAVRLIGYFINTDSIKKCALKDTDLNQLLSQGFPLDESKISQLINLMNQDVNLYHVRYDVTIENNNGDSKTISSEAIVTEDGSSPLSFTPPSDEVVLALEDKYCKIDKSSTPYKTEFAKGASKDEIGCKLIAGYREILDKSPDSDLGKSSINALASFYGKLGSLQIDACNVAPLQDKACFNFQMDMLKLSSYYYTKAGNQDQVKDMFSGKFGEEFLDDVSIGVKLKKVELLNKKDSGTVSFKIYNSTLNSNVAVVLENLGIGDEIPAFGLVRSSRYLQSQSLPAKITKPVKDAANKITEVITDNSIPESQLQLPPKDAVYRVERINPNSVNIRMYKKLEKDPVTHLERYSALGESTSVELNKRTRVPTAFEIRGSNNMNIILQRGDYIDAEATKIVSNYEAYVTITPGSGRGYVTSNFVLNIPIDPRPFEWTPQQLNSQLNTTAKILETFDKYINTLDNVVSTWKKVCLGTFAFVTLKSSLLQGTTRSLARQQSYDYLSGRCVKEVMEKGVQTAAENPHPNFDTTQDCLNHYADEMKTLTDNTQKAIDQSQTLIKGNVDDLSKTDLKVEGCGTFKKYAEAGKIMGISNTDIILNYQKCVQESLLKPQYSDRELNSYGAYLNSKSNSLGVQGLSDEMQKAEIVLNKMDAFKKLDLNKPQDVATKNAMLANFVTEISANKDRPAPDVLNIYPTLDSTPGNFKAMGIIPADPLDANPKPMPFEFVGLTKYDYVLRSNNNEITVANNEVCKEANIPSANCQTGNSNFDNAKAQWDITQAYNENHQPVYVSSNWKNIDPTSETDPIKCKQSNGEIINVGGKSGCYPKIFKSNILTQSGISYSGSYSTTSGSVNAYFDNDGFARCFPIGNGDYARIKDRTGTKTVSEVEVWNVGPNGVIDCNGGGDDEARFASNGAVIAAGLMNKIKSTDDKLRCVTGSEKFSIQGVAQKVSCIKNSAAEFSPTAQTNCYQVMDPTDCKMLFNACDPVMCPSSRCTWGGRIAPRNVIQSGIIGSTLLCLPNYKQGVAVPVCLTGIDAGLKNIRSLIQGYHDCLEIKLNQNEDVGFCDYIRSVGTCELMWREGSTIVGMTGGIIDWASSKIVGQASGGGEYLNFQSAFTNMGDSVSYFTKEYSNTYTAAFLGQSTEEIGTQICRTSINGKFPNLGSILDQITEPENPPQFTAFFDEAPYANPGTAAPYGTTSGTTPIPYGTEQLSLYKVFYHIYAGTGYYGGIYSTPQPVLSNSPSAQIQQPIIYSVYLVNKNEGYRLQPLYVTFTDAEQTQYGAMQARIDPGKYEQKSVQKVGPKGYNQVCVNINGQESCGFGKVSSSLGLTELKDVVANSEATSDIKNRAGCISDYSDSKSASVARLAALGASTASGIGELTGVVTSGIDSTIESSGIIRVCSAQAPTVESGRWRNVGTCGEENGKSLGSCWLDQNSISIDDAKLRNDALTKLAQKDLNNQDVDILSPDQSRNILFLLNQKRNEIISKIGNAVAGLNKLPTPSSTSALASATEEYKSTSSTGNVVNDVYNNYGEMIKKIVAYRDEQALIASIIAQESGGNHNAESWSGCKGLMQICSDSAVIVWPSVLLSIPNNCATTSDGKCYVCNNILCSDKDNRLIPEVSIYGGDIIYRTKLKYINAHCKLNNNIENEKLILAAYNGGEGVICAAVKSVRDTGISNPTWDQVKNEINVGLLNSYDPYNSNSWDDFKRQAKVNEIKNFPDDVLNNKDDFLAKFKSATQK